jgi:hypothetical protein
MAVPDRAGAPDAAAPGSDNLDREFPQADLSRLSDFVDDLGQTALHEARIIRDHGSSARRCSSRKSVSAIEMLCRWARRSFTLRSARRLSFSDIASVTTSSNRSTPTTIRAPQPAHGR